MPTIGSNVFQPYILFSGDFLSVLISGLGLNANAYQVLPIAVGSQASTVNGSMMVLLGPRGRLS